MLSAEIYLLQLFSTCPVQQATLGLFVAGFISIILYIYY